MKKLIALLTVVLVAFAGSGTARAETAIGAQFGYPGNAGLSLRFDRMPISAAWSSDFIHGTIDSWFIKKPLGDTDPRMSWYFGPGVDAGIPLNDNHDFFFAVRAPIGLQFMATPKIETFGEVAPGFQFLDHTDFYWEGCVGIRFVLGK
ncbi:MAG: hypothetical protein ACHQ52_14245 [Candidatus Eisenbacteria bacterium]